MAPGSKTSPPQRAPSPPIDYRGTAFRSAKRFNTGTHRAVDPEETSRTIRPYLERAGVTRIADVTGLDVVGVPTTLAIRPNAQTMACSSGKGLTADQAYASGAMEAFELHAAETARLPSVRASYLELADIYPMPAIEALPLSRGSLFSPDWPLHWFVGWDLVTKSETPVPLATVGMSRSDALISSLGAFNVSSNGLGAGNSFLEAVAAGLYEVIERDAVACSYHAAANHGASVPTLPEQALRCYPLVASVLDKCDKAAVRVIVHDCSVDTHVPTYDALVYDSVDQGVGVVRGSGSHLDPEVAILRAITEALQGRLNFIAGSRDDIFRTAFVRFRTDWAKAVGAIEADRSQSPQASILESLAGDSFEADIQLLLRSLTGADLRHVVVADLTPPDFPVHVVRVVVPGLEAYMHRGYQPGKRAMRASVMPTEEGSS